MAAGKRRTIDAQAAPADDATSTPGGGAADLDPVVVAIQVQAYELFLSRGARHGDDLAVWLEAERIVLRQIS